MAAQSWLLDGLFAGGQAEGAQVSHAARDRAALVGHPEELASPDGAVVAVASAVPRDAEGRAGNAVFGHAGIDVSEVVLHPDERQAGLLGVAGGEVIGVGVARDVVGGRRTGLGSRL